MAKNAKRVKGGKRASRKRKAGTRKAARKRWGKR